METPPQPATPSAQLLGELRDIGMPDPVSWWPPAPGWWLAAIVVGAAIFYLVRYFRQRWIETYYRKEARQILEGLHATWLESRDDRAFAAEAHQLLRRVVIHHAGREEGARWTGTAFVERVNLLSRTPLSRETGALLTEQSYRKSIEFDVDATFREIEAWLAGLEGKRRA